MIRKNHQWKLVLLCVCVKPKPYSFTLDQFPSTERAELTEANAWHCDHQWHSGCHVWWDEAMKDVPDECEPEWLDAEDPLFILYTSGSTGKPKVPQQTTALLLC